jgi:hypothetical protein
MSLRQSPALTVRVLVLSLQSQYNQELNSSVQRLPVCIAHKDVKGHIRRALEHNATLFAKIEIQCLEDKGKPINKEK